MANLIDTKEKRDNANLISAKSLMKLIGYLGILLPIGLILLSITLGDCKSVQNSISAYYHTEARNLFVGAISAIAFCLFAYRGYNNFENLLANFAAIFTIGIAFFPTSIGGPFTECLNKEIDMGLIGKLHYGAAAGLFILLACFSTFLFTKGKTPLTNNKKCRNRIYKSCGYAIFIFITLIPIYSFLIKGQYPGLDKLNPVFVLETFALIVFSISWLTKGGLIFKDEV